MKMHVFWLMSWTLFLGACLMGADLVLAGKGVSAIVLSQKPTRAARMAACELQYHLQKISGARIRILQGHKPASGVSIMVGESSFTRIGTPFDFQEYLVRVDGNEITLAGCDEPDYGAFDYAMEKSFPRHWDKIGTLYAVYDFLEMLGVRWYLPTDLGIAFLPRKDVKARDVERRRKPTLEYRDMFYKVGNYCLDFPQDLCGDTVATSNRAGLDKRETRLWFFRRRYGGRELFICHSLYSYYKRFWPAKKSWFAQGYEHEKRPPQMCYTNKGLINQVVQDAHDFFDGNMHDPSKFISNVPNDYRSDVFPLFPMDNIHICKCPSCQKYPMSTKRGIGMFANDLHSEYMFSFINEIAKKVKKAYPTKWIGTLSYRNMAYPPQTFRLEDNILLEICLHSRHVYNSTIMEQEKNLMGIWQREYPNMKKYVWMYWCFPCASGTTGNFRVFPGFFASHVGKLFRLYRTMGMEGMYHEPSYLYGKQGILFDQLEGAINWSLAWDESRDSTQLFDEFFRLYYGPAEKPMKQWYLYAESIYTAPAEYDKQTEAIAWGVLGTDVRMKKLGTFMEKAKRLATAEPYRARVALFEKGIWQYMLKGKAEYENKLVRGRSSMQQCSVAFVKSTEPGNPAKLDWKKASFLTFYGGMKAEPVKWGLDVRMAHDGKWLYVNATEGRIDTSTLKRHHELWYNDEWEFFFARHRGTPYHQLGVDANGNHIGVLKGGSSTKSWRFPGKVHVDMNKDSWRVLLAIPLKSFGPDGLKPGDLFYGNIIRSGGLNKVIGVWVPTFAGYHAPNRFGEFYLAPETSTVSSE